MASRSWNYGAKAARTAFAEIAEAIAAYEQVYLFVRPQDKASAQELLSSERIHLIEAPTEDAWARDTGATFVVNDQGGRRGIQWEFNAWGGQYDGLYSHFEHDREVPERICSFLGDSFYNARPFVLEGGSIHVDGEGTLLTTEECLLSPGRNPSLTRAEIEEKLRQYLSVEKIIWLPFGIYNDETNGHIDNMCCFVKPGEVLLAWTDDENDPQYARSRAAFDLLSHTVDAKGRSFVIHKLPIPKHPICITEEDLLGYNFEAGEDQREAGERLAASYINFYLANHCVLLPRFGDEKRHRGCRNSRKMLPGSTNPSDRCTRHSDRRRQHSLYYPADSGKEKRKQIMRNIKIAALQFHAAAGTGKYRQSRDHGP